MIASMKVKAHCLQCAKQHEYDFNPFAPKLVYQQLLSEWYVKHAGHVGVGYRWPQFTPKPSWTDRAKKSWEFTNKDGTIGVRPLEAGGRFWYPGTDVEVMPAIAASLAHNADVKIAYAATTTPTMTLASLAASSTLLAGRESTALDNGASVKYLDKLAAGNYKSGAANNQAGSILTCVVGARDDTPTWPDVFDGTDSAETVSLQGIFDAVCRVISSIAGTNGASVTWNWGPVGIAGFWGGALMDQYIYFTTQSIQTSTNVWSATESDHAVRETGVYLTVA